ncbi:MAG: NADAR family protein [Okeania sp. SIO2C9]|uniref:NADAR family protein n=1 Tax=Okeania sp. SIO2C9 TaxID=2607791 RepID=UPI0013C0D0E2|nr:NADAR family protein [Okeania sp. SIO2C9]NEQ78125.1 NADAR family protein [Okeania sp. SIO2C9]
MTTTPESRTYHREDCVTFRKTSEQFGGLSNMAGGYRLLVNDVEIFTSEALYQACRFPNLPDVQRLIIAQRSPMTAKMKSKPHRWRSRSDWEQVKVAIMGWCLRVKLAQNWENFGQLLLSTENRPIVEDSRKDDFWGAIPVDSETLVGINALGRLLMELRELLKQPDADSSLQVVEPPTLPDFLLYEEPIGVINMNANHQIFAEVNQEKLERPIPKLVGSKFNGNGEKTQKLTEQGKQLELNLWGE